MPFRAVVEPLEDRNVPATVSVSLANAVITEGSVAAFIFTRDSAVGDLVLSYRIGGSATAADFSTPLSGAATILNGQTSVAVNATSLNDGVLEPGETLTVVLLDSSTFTLGTVSQATALIRDANGGQATYRDLFVGPGQTYATVAAANAAAQNGDFINVLATGTYTSDTATITKNNLTIRGIGAGRANLSWNTASNIPNAKGILLQQTGQSNLTVENLTLQGARVADGNGAGIRAQGTNLTVTNCYFTNNQNGILNGLGEILIQYSEFARNGIADGQTHNIYIGTGTTKLTFQYNYSHDVGVIGVSTNLGHLFKSRADVNLILYNRFDDGASAASYEINLPNGGQNTIIGNIIIQQSISANGAIIDYGSETSPHGPLTGDFLYLANNTVVNKRSAGTFVSLNNLPANFDFTSKNNIFAGPGTVYSLAGATTTVRSDVGNRKASTVAAAGFVNAATGDYHLAAGSSAINLGVAPGNDPNANSLIPLNEYLGTAAFKARTADAVLDAGAYDYFDATPPTVTGLTPTIGPTTGGVLIAITGSNFLETSSVRIQGAADPVPIALAFAVVSASQITATLPAHTAGAVDVVVVNPGGTASLSGLSDFTYATPAVVSVVINGGPNITLTANGQTASLAGQHSVVKQILVTFNQPVTVASDAFTVTPRTTNVTVNGGFRPSTNAATTSVTTISPTSYLVTFLDDHLDPTPSTHDGGILNSGIYDLTILAAKVTARGEPLASNQTTPFFALYGNIEANNLYNGANFTAPIPAGFSSGDGHSNIFVDPASLFQFSDTFGSTAATPTGPPAYKIAFDANLDGAIDPADLFAFSDAFGSDWTF